MFLPVMRGTLSLPAMRDPEVLERLTPNNVLNMCTRLQVINPFTKLLLELIVTFNLPTVSLQLVRNENRSRSDDDQHEGQRLGSRHRTTFDEND
jgi:Tumour suppressor protein